MPKRRTKGTLILAVVLVLSLLPLVILARPGVPPEEGVAQVIADASPALDRASPTPAQADSSAAPISPNGERDTPPQARMHLAEVRGEIHIDPYGNHQLVVYVMVHSADHEPLGGVEVDASIWWPNGGPIRRMRVTHANGTARFHWGSTEAGKWKLCVTSLTRDGYLDDLEDAEVPSCMEWSN